MDINTILEWWRSSSNALFDQYESLGRPILDALHIIFDNAFHVLLWFTFLLTFVFAFMAIYTIKKREWKEDVDESYTPLVTVQIPTFNELAAIQCAKACLDFDYPKEKFEILIGDDSSDKDISKIIAEFGKEHPGVKIIKREKNIGYKPGNLNNMLQHSKGEFLVIFDSDFVPGKDFLKRIVQPFKDNPKLAGVQARWTFTNTNENLITILGSSILNVYHHISLVFFKSRTGLCYFCGSAEAVRKSTLIELGTWDSGNLTEDIEFSIRAVNAGHRITYLPTLTCDSELPHTPRDFYRQQMRWAYGVITSFKKHFLPTYSNHNTSFEEKFCTSVVGCGYLLSFLFLSLFITGFLSLITHAPEPVNWPLFFSETGKNILLTSGLMFANVVALMRSHNIKLLFSMILSSFSYGIITLYYVNKGIIKALLGRKMEWFMLTKKSNVLPANYA